MRLIINIPDDLYTRLFDDGIDPSMSDIKTILTAIRKGRVQPKYEKYLPCTCGCKKRTEWTNTDPTKNWKIKLVCNNCGKVAYGKNRVDAKRNWNKMVLS